MFLDNWFSDGLDRHSEEIWLEVDCPAVPSSQESLTIQNFYGSYSWLAHLYDMPRRSRMPSSTTSDSKLINNNE